RPRIAVRPDGVLAVRVDFQHGLIESSAVPVTAADLSTLAASHDIISLGMRADEVRRKRHGTRTTFVRVANVPADPQTPPEWPAAAGEIRIVGTPAGRAAAADCVRNVVSRANGVPVSAFSLA